MTDLDEAKNVLEDAKKRLDNTPREFLQCPVCLSGIRELTQEGAYKLLELHARLAHPEIKEDLVKGLHYVT